jgi:GTP cyclohydrolase I
MTHKEMADAIRDFLLAAGQDTESEHLRDTPNRVARAYQELLTPPEFNFTVFPNTEKYDQVVLQTGIRFTSLCAHHLLSFSGVAHVAYIPHTHYVGLSKLARCVEYFSHRLQIQESLTSQIGNFLNEKLSPMGVAVIVTATHSCMGIRGVKQPQAATTTSYIKGVFMSSPPARAELMSLIQLGGPYD